MTVKKHLIYPILAAVLGLIASMLRGYELITGFERDTQLMHKGHIPSYLMIVFTLLCIGLFLLMSRFKNVLGGDKYVSVFRIENNISLVIAVMSVLFLFVAAGLQFGVFMVGGQVLYLIMAFFTVFCAVCLLLTLSARRSGKSDNNIRIFVITPVFWGSYTLIIYFSEISVDPVMIDYIYDLSGYIFILLALYASATFAFGRENPLICVFFLLTATFISILAVGGPVIYAFAEDGVSIIDAVSKRLIFVFAALYMPFMASSLIKNMKRFDIYGLDNGDKSL